MEEEWYGRRAAHMIRRKARSFHRRVMRTPTGWRALNSIRIGMRPRGPQLDEHIRPRNCVWCSPRALSARPDTRARSIRVIAYDPGPTPGTGLVRHQGPLVRFVWERMAMPLRLFMRKANTIDAAGSTLAALALE